MEIHVSYTYFKKNNKNKWNNSFFNLLTTVQACGWQEPVLIAQGARWEPTLDRIPFHQRVNSHIHSDWDNLETIIHLTCTSLGCGRKLESPEKMHADMGRICKLHTDKCPGLESFFFLLINVIMKRCYLRSCYRRVEGIIVFVVEIWLRGNKILAFWNTWRSII